MFPIFILIDSLDEKSRSLDDIKLHLTNEATSMPKISSPSNDEFSPCSNDTCLDKNVVCNSPLPLYIFKVSLVGLSPKVLSILYFLLSSSISSEPPYTPPEYGL